MTRQGRLLLPNSCKARRAAISDRRLPVVFRRRGLHSPAPSGDYPGLGRCAQPKPSSGPGRVDPVGGPGQRIGALREVARPAVSCTHRVGALGRRRRGRGPYRGTRAVHTRSSRIWGSGTDSGSLPGLIGAGDGPAAGRCRRCTRCRAPPRPWPRLPPRRPVDARVAISASWPPRRCARGLRGRRRGRPERRGTGRVRRPHGVGPGRRHRRSASAGSRPASCRRSPTPTVVGRRPRRPQPLTGGERADRGLLETPPAGAAARKVVGPAGWPRHRRVLVT